MGFNKKYSIKHSRDILQKFIMKNKITSRILNENFKRRFPSSQQYWETRYLRNGNSGNGSYGEIAAYKAGILNKFVEENNIKTIMEFGCGDGNQLQQFKFPLYVGLDVSLTAIKKCIQIFEKDTSKSFFIYHYKGFADNSRLFQSQLVLSLDVIYHLLEDEVYENYMHHLFSSSTKYVIIYAWDVEGKKNLHVRHRKFSEWIATNKKNWHLVKRIENKAAPTCDFFIYEKDNDEVFYKNACK